MSANSMPAGGAVRRLALAAALVAVVGLSLGLDAGMAVAFSLAVMEVDARRF